MRSLGYVWKLTLPRFVTRQIMYVNVTLRLVLANIVAEKKQ